MFTYRVNSIRQETEHSVSALRNMASVTFYSSEAKCDSGKWDFFRAHEQCDWTLNFLMLLITYVVNCESDI